MKDRRVLCYLRTHRRVWGLTQDELARLLGLASPTQVSRLEQLKRKRGPGIEAALACQVLFGVTPSDMFPAIHREVEERVIQRVYQLHQGLEHLTNLSALRKRDLLESALRRATGKTKTLMEV